MAKRLAGKVILISGGTKGVGKAAAEAFIKEGAQVAVAGRDKKSCPEGAFFVHTDLTKVADIENFFKKSVKKFGKVDGFFNYAGITPISPLDICTEETFDAVMDVNFKAAFFACQQAVKYMRINGGGSIVLTGSAHAQGGQKDRAAYACSKGVLKTLSDHIAKNYAEENIRSNYLVLGWTLTEGEIALRKTQGKSEEELKKEIEASLPMGVACVPKDYVETLILLMSDSSKIMTGSEIRMTAGEYI